MPPNPSGCSLIRTTCCPEGVRDLFEAKFKCTGGDCDCEVEEVITLSPSESDPGRWSGRGKCLGDGCPEGGCDVRLTLMCSGGTWSLGGGSVSGVCAWNQVGAPLNCDTGVATFQSMQSAPDCKCCPMSFVPTICVRQKGHDGWGDCE